MRMKDTRILAKKHTLVQRHRIERYNNDSFAV